MSENAADVAAENTDTTHLQPGQQVDAAAVAADVEVPANAADDGQQLDSETPDDDADALDPLVEEGEVAADYLEELLDLADLDGDIDIEVRNGRTYLSVLNEDESTEDLNVLVGANGEVLDSLQELVRLAVLATTEHRSRLVLDVAGHRQQRAETLREMAMQAVEEARTSGKGVHLDPLSPYERKIVHDVVAEAGLHSESEGEGARRHIVVAVQN